MEFVIYKYFYICLKRERAVKASRGASRSAGGMNTEEMREYLMRSGVDVREGAKRLELEVRLGELVGTSEVSLMEALPTEMIMKIVEEMVESANAKIEPEGSLYWSWWVNYTDEEWKVYTELMDNLWNLMQVNERMLDIVFQYYVKETSPATYFDKCDLWYRLGKYVDEDILGGDKFMSNFWLSWWRVENMD